MTTLSALIRPPDRYSHDLDSRRSFRAPDHYMARILFGVEDGSFDTFISSITSQTISLDASSHRETIEVLWLLVLQATYTKPASLAVVEYMHALLRHQPLWNHLICAIHTPGYIQDDEQREYTQDDLFQDITRLISCSTSYTSTMAYDRQQGRGDTSLCEEFVKTLVRADIFDALENVLVAKVDNDELFAGARLDQSFLSEQHGSDNAFPSRPSWRYPR